MAELDIVELGKQMLQAALNVLGSGHKKIRTYAELELSKLTQTLATIQQLLLTDQITAQEAQILIEMQRNASRSVLLTIEGVGLVEAEQAVNAALSVGRAALERTLGIKLV